MSPTLMGWKSFEDDMVMKIEKEKDGDEGRKKYGLSSPICSPFYCSRDEIFQILREVIGPCEILTDPQEEFFPRSFRGSLERS